jgi:hypothetical protein
LWRKLGCELLETKLVLWLVKNIISADTELHGGFHLP